MSDDPAPQPVYVLTWPSYELVENPPARDEFVGVPTEPPPTQET